MIGHEMKESPERHLPTLFERIREIFLVQYRHKHSLPVSANGRPLATKPPRIP